MAHGSGRAANRVAGSIALVALLASCSTAPQAPATSQRLRIETPGCAAAQCVLSNDKGRWIVAPTPGEVEVLVSAQPLEVACHAREQSAGASVPPGPRREISAAGTAGGGALGAGAGAAASAPLLATPYAPLVGVFALYGAVVGAGAARAVDATGRGLAYPTPLSLPFRCDPAGIDPRALASAPLGIAVRAAAIGEPQAAAIVSALANEGLGARAGLRIGDAIVSVGGRPVDSPAALEDALRRAPDAPLPLGVMRGAAAVEIVLPARARP
jgi:hypothetical protein